MSEMKEDDLVVMYVNGSYNHCGVRAIRFLNEDGLDLEVNLTVIKKLCRNLFPDPSDKDGWSTILCKKVEELNQKFKAIEDTFCNCPVPRFESFEKRIRECEERTRAYPERNRWQLLLEQLEERVKVLEDVWRLQNKR